MLLPSQLRLSCLSCQACRLYFISRWRLTFVKLQLFELLSNPLNNNFVTLITPISNNGQITLQNISQFSSIINSKFNVAFCQMKSQKQNKNPNQIPKKSFLSASSYLNNQEPLFEKCLAKKTICKTHSKQIGKYFCADCFQYNICMDCISQNHSNHSFLQFKGFEQSKQFTKELILQEVQETLKKLKSKQNEVNNQIAEVKIIKDKLKSLQDQIIASLRHSFQSLQQKIVQKYECEYKKYEKELDAFYEEHNRVNDHLRRNLIQIIDNQIDIYEFSRQKIYKQIDQKYVPNFGKIKLIMEKCKKYYKNIGESLKPLQDAIKFFNKEEIKHNSKFQKYDRFLKEKTVNEGDYFSPLLKTLNLIEKNQCDFPLMISKLRN